MSVLLHNEDNSLAILSHSDFMIKSVGGDREKIDQLFDIRTPFRMDAEAIAVARRMRDTNNEDRPKKRRKIEMPSCLQAETEYLKEKISIINTHYKEKYFPGSPSIADIEENNRNLRIYVDQLMKCADASLSSGQKTGRNGSDDAVQSGEHLLPPHSEYRLCDINELGGDSTYEVILMDPPWENKHVKRAKGKSTGYNMLSNDDIRKIPIDKMLVPDGILVIWCSNSIRHREAIREWLDYWRLKEIAKWYWLKLTKHGETICQFSPGKNPYEVIIIASQSSHVGLPKELVLCSVPSGVHSHKPPLSMLLDTWFKHLRRRLEIFGRYLQEGWTTIGLEACKLNHSLIYKSLPETSLTA